MLSSKGFEVFRGEVKEALQGLAKKYDFNIKPGNISYSQQSFSLKLDVSKKEINGKSKEQVDFEKSCHAFGFKPEDFGKSFSYQGDRYKLVGFKPRSPKYPVLGESANGRVYKFPPEIVQDVLQ